MSSWQEVQVAPIHRMKDAIWVKVVARIRFNATGEIREYATDEILENGESTPSVFNWEENNFACDCNRYLFFTRAGGQEPDDEHRCGGGAYSVQLVNPVDGQVYYDEFEEVIK